MDTIRRRGLAALITAAVAAVAAVVVLSAGAGAADPREIAVLEPVGEGTEVWFDLGGSDTGPGADAGDLLVERKPLVDPGSHEPVGELVARFQVVEIDAGVPVLLVDGTARLDGGDLTFHGSATFADFESGATFAVTGGTDEFDRAAGSVTFTFGEQGVLIEFRLTKR